MYIRIFAIVARNIGWLASLHISTAQTQHEYTRRNATVHETYSAAYITYQSIEKCQLLHALLGHVLHVENACSGASGRLLRNVPRPTADRRTLQLLLLGLDRTCGGAPGQTTFSAVHSLTEQVRTYSGGILSSFAD